MVPTQRPEAQCCYRELCKVFHHLIMKVWNNDLGWRVVEVMDTHKVCFTTIDIIHLKTVNIDEVPEDKEDTDDADKVLEAKKLVVGPVTIWIDVEVFEDKKKGADTINVERPRVQIEAQELMGKAEETRKALQSLLDQVEKHWNKLNNCVIGHVLCSPALSVLVSNSGWESYDILLDIMPNGAAHGTNALYFPCHYVGQQQ
ncbi:hypothetical protein EDC04DRAFT_2602375 [Pisolithus marmoratus]|nr:hypothetical protein EDC04DRAFT_2602375 [Pisolithus marmoratus]